MSFGTNLVAAPGLVSVPAWDTATPLAGGASAAPLNVQAQALLNLIAYFSTTGGSNQVGHDPLGSYDPNTVGGELLALASSVIPLGGQPGQIVFTPDGAGGYTIGFASPATFPGAVNMPGTTAGAEPSAGMVGEYMEAKQPSTSAVALTTAVAANIITLALTPGDWDVGGSLDFTGSATSVTYFSGGLSTASANAPSEEFLMSQRGSATSPLAVDARFAVPTRRVNVSANTTIYLIGQAGFSSGTCSGYGKIWARRRR